METIGKRLAEFDDDVERDAQKDEFYIDRYYFLILISIGIIFLILINHIQGTLVDQTPKGSES